MVTDHLVICGQLENCTLTFMCPLALKDKLGGLRAKWENWMMGGIHEYNKTGQMKRPSYKDIVAWIVESWAAVSENCVSEWFH